MERKRLMRSVATILALALCLCGGAALKADDESVKKTPEMSFDLKDLDGKSFKSADFKDKYIVLEWTESGCPAVKPLYKAKKVQKLVAEYKAKDVQWFSVCSTKHNTIEGLKKFTKQYGVEHKILADFDGKVGKRFGAKRTPHVFIMKNGKVLYQGAFDNRRSGENYVKKALDELLANKEVSTPRTKPYG
jgi:peroxiredoxin